GFRRHIIATLHNRRSSRMDLPHRRLLWLILIVPGLTALGARGENWPQFRGPTGQGISTEKHLPTEWSKDQNVAWRTEIPGDGWSSPIVWGDRVFLTTALESGSACDVICVDARSGKVLWDVEVFRQ